MISERFLLIINDDVKFNRKMEGTLILLKESKKKKLAIEALRSK